MEFNKWKNPSNYVLLVFSTLRAWRKTIIHLEKKTKGYFTVRHYRVWSNLSVGEAGRRLVPVWTQLLSAWVIFWAANSHYWQRQDTVFETILTQLDDFYGNMVLLVSFGKRTWKNGHLEYENQIRIFMFQSFLDLLQPEGTWGKYELKPKFQCVKQWKDASIGFKRAGNPTFLWKDPSSPRVFSESYWGKSLCI